MITMKLLYGTIDLYYRSKQKVNELPVWLVLASYYTGLLGGLVALFAGMASAWWALFALPCFLTCFVMQDRVYKISRDATTDHDEAE